MATTGDLYLATSGDFSMAIRTERWTSKAGSLVGQLRGCSCGDYKKIIHGGVPG